MGPLRGFFARIGQFMRTRREVARSKGLSAAGDFWRRHEDRFHRIRPNAAILGGRPVSAERVAAERAKLRAEANPGTARRVWRGAVLVVFCAAVVAGFVNDLDKTIEGHRSLVGWVLGSVLLVGFLVWLRRSPRASKEIRKSEEQYACGLRRLGVSSGSSRDGVVLDWLDRFWRWPLPPDFFDGSIEDAQGVWRGHPFLVAAEVEVGSDSDFRSPLNRTCVFIAGLGGVTHRADATSLPPCASPVHTIITPAGLFAYSAGTVLFALEASEWERMLDGLVDLAYREGIQPWPHPAAELAGTEGLAAQKENPHDTAH